ncbi:MAG: thioredoxin domain-containing protein, partial [Calditrichia bacterium]|nr:thioredoxin domain-containing protein [Calditrichia bacterium]
GRILYNEEYLQIAEKNIQFINKNMIGESSDLLHSYRDRNADIKGNLDDYAFYIFGLLEYYESTFQIEYLQQAIQLSGKLVEQFYDEKTSDLFFSPKDGEKLIIRSKDLYDGAIPSGFSLAIHNFLKISKLTGDTKWEELSHKIVEKAAFTINRWPSGLTMLLSAMQLTSVQSMEIVIVGEPGNKETKEILKYINKQFLPDKVIILKTKNNSKALAKIAPYTENYEKVNNKTTVYICRNYQCQQPVTNIKELSKLLIKKVKKVK